MIKANRYLFFALILSVGMLSGCDKYKDVGDGLFVKHVVTDKNEIGPQFGNFVKIRVSIADGEGNKIYPDQISYDETYLRCDPNEWKAPGPVYGVLRYMNVGDSVVGKASLEKIYRYTFGIQVPDTLKGTDFGYIYMSMSEELSPAEFEIFLEKQSEERHVEELEQIKEYLEGHNLSAITLESGLSIVVTQEGNGMKPQVNDLVEVHYTGKLFNGQKFDSSLDGNETFKFVVGQGNVIPGWDEGLMQLNVGSKATLLIPSKLGYGNGGTGGIIPPNSILLFDVELISTSHN